MGAVRYRLISGLRHRWRSTVAFTLLVAVVFGVVITVAAGAHRTATAPDRYTSSSQIEADGIVTQDGGRPRTDEIAELGAVAAVDSVTFVFGSVTDPTGADPGPALVFSGSPRAIGMRLVSGRETDPDNAGEFVASQSFVDAAQAEIGDTVEVVTFTQQQADDGGFGTPNPEGPRVMATLVGVIDGPTQLDDPTPLVVVSPALLREPEVGVALTLNAVDLRDDVDLSQLRAQLDTLPDSQKLSLDPAEVISDEVRRAVSTQAQGLWLLALAAAVAAIAVIGQMITRQVRPTPADRERLGAIGFTNHQVVEVAMGHAVIPIVVGSLLGAALAIIPSGLFPTGFVGTIEPTPGVFVDWNVLAGAAVVSIIALTLWTFVSLTVTGSRSHSAVPSPAVDALATHTTSSAAATGMRLAFGRFASDHGPARGSMVGVMLTIAGITAALTFGVSLDRLIEEPFRYGTNYDAAIGDNGGTELPPGFADRLDAQPDVASLILYFDDSARVGDTTVPVLGMEIVRGEGTPTVVAGRLPVGNDEIAFGRVTARDIDAEIGDEVTLVGATGTALYQVTGLVVVPGLGANDGLGHGGLVTPSGLTKIDADARPTMAAVQLRGSYADFAATVPELADTAPNDPYQPGAIVNIARVRTIPFALAVVLAALALLTVGHVMVTSTRGSRRELAILRSLGARSGWIARAVHWHATLFTLFCVAVGIPLGVIIGRLVWIAFAQNMGAIDNALVPVAAVVVGVLAIVALANVAAAIPARRARRVRPAQLLRTE
jgi:ABC-type lipoprotein release transport system permease subunit